MRRAGTRMEKRIDLHGIARGFQNELAVDPSAPRDGAFGAGECCDGNRIERKRGVEPVRVVVSGESAASVHVRSRQIAVNVHEGQFVEQQVVRGPLKH